MRSIKFSHRYTKHPLNVRDGSTVKLIEVLNSKFEYLSSSFIEYDTKYYCEGHYKSPKNGDCLVLLLLGEGPIYGSLELFTTVRRNTPENEKYYRALRGQQMNVEIGEEWS